MIDIIIYLQSLVSDKKIVIEAIILYLKSFNE